jgi:Ni/Fe-hydrogenase 1 B-type cytochrome subunit
MAKIDKRLIWSGWLRLTHLVIGLATLLLIGSGWLIAYAPSVETGAIDTHYMAASALVFGLALRLLLMFRGTPVERVSRLMPEDNEWGAVLDTLRFYLSFGKAPLPRWHAHNPLWKPIYLLLYLCLLVMVLTGWLRMESPVFLGFYLPSVHGLFATVVVWISALHVLTVILHDYRGEAADVSSMINGHRHFVIENPVIDSPELQQATVRLDQIGKPTSSKKD